ncbi:hypothetical protein EDD91_0344 [Streptomyces sp. KS 21]|nr:hypothetical protein EDD91_0344 [Streptomyces sp. KS 21]
MAEDGKGGPSAYRKGLQVDDVGAHLEGHGGWHRGEPGERGGWFRVPDFL